ncbi:hypothetical protein EI94DRAFT_1701830 [Lactarius quietus]|nr:hypothetical protein EI94DRAFT_1701830 [Lactarius quietus]
MYHVAGLCISCVVVPASALYSALAVAGQLGMPQSMECGGAEGDVKAELVVRGGLGATVVGRTHCPTELRQCLEEMNSCLLDMWIVLVVISHVALGHSGKGLGRGIVELSKRAAGTEVTFNVNFGGCLFVVMGAVTTTAAKGDYLRLGNCKINFAQVAFTCSLLTE